MTSFGHVLKDIRAAHGLSQTALALALDSTQRHVSFLETGRSLPTASYLARLCRAMNLNIAQRINLYDASGLANPYVSRDMGSDEIRDALDMIEERVLKNWPFPALVLDPDWNVLRQNDAFTLFFKPLAPQGNEQMNLLEVLMSDILQSLIQNWDEAAGVLFFRLQRAAAHSPRIAKVLLAAQEQGRFEGMEQHLNGLTEIPVFLPIRLVLPNGPEIQISSLLGKLASSQDALIDGLEIELMVPLDETSEQTMRALASPK
jgi:transcriptional regulator with XRE-family HTH domain